ncbi:MAG: DUF4212 domain-containing protein [Candidatus Cyclonatronum sp.]|uniref:DUF4212 domain-containing protein n=1 Tax=Cyclonatronum sp. TaxID=3024185 RepID=UPI0025C238A4|nr:DUF4212 domain-containing protein [Cyclonatronum sp.]MCC5933833.1 DUF4212 domain-containing protein [Balneolales bacterium]MCH8487882.1 DUF4212 domain-containing protein [Cyclonatronum sp.]
MEHKEMAKAYWKKNLTYVGGLLFIWFMASFGAGILFVDYLDNFTLGGFPLGFWFAQQGSMYIFVIVIAAYMVLMNKLDKEFGFDEQD